MIGNHCEVTMYLNSVDMSKYQLEQSNILSQWCYIYYDLESVTYILYNYHLSDRERTEPLCLMHHK